MCNMTHSCVWHDSVICVTWLSHICDMTHTYVWHDSFICVTWLVPKKNVSKCRCATHKRRRYELFLCRAVNTYIKCVYLLHNREDRINLGSWRNLHICMRGRYELYVCLIVDTYIYIYIYIQTHIHYTLEKIVLIEVHEKSARLPPSEADTNFHCVYLYVQIYIPTYLLHTGEDRPHRGSWRHLHVCLRAMQIQTLFVFNYVYENTCKHIFTTHRRGSYSSGFVKTSARLAASDADTNSFRVSLYIRNYV